MLKKIIHALYNSTLYSVNLSWIENSQTSLTCQVLTHQSN